MLARVFESLDGISAVASDLLIKSFIALCRIWRPANLIRVNYLFDVRSYYFKINCWKWSVDPHVLPGSIATAIHSDINQTAGSSGHLSIWENRCMHATVCLRCETDRRRGEIGSASSLVILVGRNVPSTSNCYLAVNCPKPTPALCWHLFRRSHPLPQGVEPPLIFTLSKSFKFQRIHTGYVCCTLFSTLEIIPHRLFLSRTWWNISEKNR